MLVSPEKIDEMYADVGGDFKELFDKHNDDENEGSVREGKIIKIDNEHVMVDVQEKKEARMSVDEIKDSKGNLLFKEGDTLQVFVSHKGGLKVSYKKAHKYHKIQQEIESLGANYKDKVVEGVITKRNKGGFVVESKSGVEYFMPKQYSAIRDDAKSVVGKEVKACIVDVRKETSSIVISRKRYLDMNSSLQKENAKKLIESGLAYDGVVRSITDFGMFVDVGGVEGLVHLSEISYKGHIKPHKLYKVGDKVQVKPLEYNEEKNKLSFSIRALFDDPWKDITNDIKVGYVIRVSVSNIEPYGAFVDLGNDIEGFLHISEMSWEKNVKKVEDILKVGQEIDVEVIEIDSNNRKLRVSLKKTQDKPFVKFTKEHKVGDVIKGKVASVLPFGVFVNLAKGVDGLLHNEDAFWDKNKKCADVFKEGDSIEVKIDKIDKENEKISLNKKTLSESPCEEFAKKHNIDDEITGKIIDIKDFGVFIKVDGEGIDALIRNEDIDKNTKENLKIGDSIKAALISVDKKANRVRLSVRRLYKKQELQELREYNSKHDSKQKSTLGDALGNALKELKK